jgi:hypothetical protein
MRVDQYLKQVPLSGGAAFYTDVPDILAASLRSGKFPPPCPPPYSRHLLTGAPADPLNAFRLELTALSRGYDRALWIGAADAAFLSLRPKVREAPLFTAFRSRNDHLSYQYLYLLDSFTPQSLLRLSTLANPDVNRRCQDTGKPLSGAALSARSRTAERALYYTAAADSGLDTRAPRIRAAQQYRRNSSSDSRSPLFFMVHNLYKTYTANISRPARKAFDYLRKYRSQQLTSLTILEGGEKIDDATQKSFAYIAASENREAVPAVFYAFSFASQLCRGELTPQTVEFRKQHSPRSVSAGVLKNTETPLKELRS